MIEKNNNKECATYVQEAMSDVKNESDFKNAVVHCLEFMADKIDSQSVHFKQDEE